MGVDEEVDTLIVGGGGGSGGYVGSVLEVSKAGVGFTPWHDRRISTARSVHRPKPFIFSRRIGGCGWIWVVSS